MPRGPARLIRLLAAVTTLGWLLDRWREHDAPPMTMAAASDEAGAGSAPRRRAWILGFVVMAVAVSTGGAGWWLLQVREAKNIARALTGGEPDRAPALITRYGCGGCHTIPGIPGADGRVAAPLNGLLERVYVGGVARNTAANLTGWIVNPRAFSPRSAMPATGITEDEARDVAAYLYTQ
ncbi:MAG: putative cytochrome c class protein [Roseomonas sp.]|nr:putative cytochrome c class protein [Roseomonas sp.]